MVTVLSIVFMDVEIGTSGRWKDTDYKCSKTNLLGKFLHLITMK